MLKIAIILPVGPLDRWGYQYHHDLTVANHCAFATRVYIGRGVRPCDPPPRGRSGRPRRLTPLLVIGPAARKRIRAALIGLKGATQKAQS